MSGNFSVSNNLSVGNNISCNSLTASTATIPTLTVNNLAVSGSSNTGAFQSLTTTNVNTTTLAATSQISSPTILVGTKNVGTTLSTLQNDMSTAQTTIATIQTKTTNQSYAPSTQTTTILGTLSTPALTLNGNDLNSRIQTSETSITTLQGKTTNQTFSPTTQTTTFFGTLATPAFLLNGTDLNSKIQGSEASITALQGKTTNLTYASATQTTSISGILATPALTLNGTDINTRIGNSETAITTLQAKTANQAASANTTAFSGSVTASGGITATTLTTSGLITANGGISLPASKVLTLTGNISANSLTVTPAQVGYLNGATSNIQSQLTAVQNKVTNLSLSGDATNGYTSTFLGTVATPAISLNGKDLNTRLTEIAAGPSQLLSSANSWTDTNTFNRVVLNGRNNITDGAQTAIDNITGLHLQSNRVAADGMSYIMNNKGLAAGNGGFRVQRYDGTGNFIDEPITVADTITLSKNTEINGNLSCSSSITTASNSIFCKGLMSDTLRTLNEYGNVSFVLIDAETIDGAPSSITSFSATACNIATVTVPKNGSYRCSVSCPVGFRGKQTNLLADILYTRQLVASNIKWILVNPTNNSIISFGSNVTFTDDKATTVRGYTIKAPLGEYKQYITNVILTVDLPYDAYNEKKYNIYLDLGQKDVVINYKSTLTYFVNTISPSVSGTTFSAISLTSNSKATGILTGSVEANELYAQSATFPNLYSPLVGNLAGFVRGGYGYQPIICTITDTDKFYGTGTGITNRDYAYIIFPKFKLILYEDPGFGREYSVSYSAMANLNLDNTNGTQPMIKTVTLPSGSGVGSIRVFYNNVEVSIPFAGITT